MRRVFFSTFSAVFAGLFIGLLVGLAPVTAQSAEPIVAALQPFVDSGGMPGFVTVMATKEKILSVDCVGWENIETEQPMRENSVFWAASMTKGFVGAAAMLMVEEGKLDLDAPITTYIPEFADLQVYKRNDKEELADSGFGRIVEVRNPESVMTTRQCLCHTAGWRFVTPYQKKWGIDSLDHQHQLTVMAIMGLDDDPGKKYSYSNVGINVAAAVVERVAGMPLEQLLQERIFDPLGMTETTFWPTEEQLSRRALCYEWKPEQRKLVAMEGVPFLGEPLSDRTHRYPEGGGGLFSTAPDFVKFYQMLASGGEYQGRRILAPESVEVMVTKQTADGIDSKYGLGLDAGDMGFGHGGAAGTRAAAFKNGLICIYMVQIKDAPEAKKAIDVFTKSAMLYFMSAK